MSDVAQCAHLKAVRKKSESPDGIISEWWECSENCGTKFHPENSLVLAAIDARTCPGGCGGLVSGKYRYCASCQEGADILNRNAIKLLKEEREAVQNDSRVLTCVFCGHQYPPGTPASNHAALAAHVLVCPEHPAAEMRKTIAEITTKARDAFKMLGYTPGVVIERAEVPNHAAVLHALDKIIEAHDRFVPPQHLGVQS